MNERCGITEMKHLEGHLKFWRELLVRHPELIIDSCASGGRRNDLESLRLAIPLLRSDQTDVIVSQQCQYYGYAMWVPLHGMVVSGPDRYGMRSSFSPYYALNFQMLDRSIDYERVREDLKIWRAIAGDYYGDYYPLTQYSQLRDAWMAWQQNRPEKGRGFVQAFRKLESHVESCRFLLRGLEREAKYSVKDMDRPEAEVVISGRTLMEDVFAVRIRNKPGFARFRLPQAGRSVTWPPARDTCTRRGIMAYRNHDCR